jgi:hypothetical protein
MMPVTSVRRIVLVPASSVLSPEATALEDEIEETATLSTVIVPFAESIPVILTFAPGAKPDARETTMPIPNPATLSTATVVLPAASALKDDKVAVTADPVIGVAVTLTPAPAAVHPWSTTIVFVVLSTLTILGLEANPANVPPPLAGESTIPTSKFAALATLITVAGKVTPVSVTEDADAGIKAFKLPVTLSIVVPGSIPGPDNTIPGINVGRA